MPSEPTHRLNEPPNDPEPAEPLPMDQETPSVEHVLAQEPPASELEPETPPSELETPAAAYELAEEPVSDPVSEPPAEPLFAEPMPPPTPFEPTARDTPFSQLPPIQPMPHVPPGGGAAYSMPQSWPGMPDAQAAALVAPPPRLLFGFPIKTVLLIAVPLCIIAVVAFFLINNSGPDTTSAPPPAITTASAPPPTDAAPTSLGAGTGGAPVSTPDAAPVTLPQGTTATPMDPSATSTGGEAASGSLVGRWESKGAGFYEFRGDGSGVRGSAKNGPGNESFTWSVADNHLNLSVEQGGDTKQETLGFSFGPDHKSVFLRQPDGHTREYSRAADAA